MRKILTVLLAAASLTFVACDKNASPDEQATAETTTTAEAAESAEAGEASEEAEGSDEGEVGAAAAAPSEPAEIDPRLLEPEKATEKAPDTYRVKFDTTKGDFTVKVDRSMAPKAADRFYNLVKIGYYDDVAFFRVIDNFMAQFGIHGTPEVNKVWREARIEDDPVKESNTRGMVTFATAGPDTRTTQLFINYKDNANLDAMGFAPFGEVEGDGMKVVDSLYKGYGEGAPRGRGPAQGRLQAEGNTYLRSDFPELDYIKEAKIVEE